MRACLITFAVLLLAFAPAPLPRRPTGRDHESQLVGSWRIKTIKWRGGDYGSAVFGNTVVSKTDWVTISRGRVVFEAEGRSSGDRTFTLRLSGAGEVRNVDFGEKAGGLGETRNAVLGLYQLRGGVLYLSYGIHNDGRPKSLSGNGNEIAFILERR